MQKLSASEVVTTVEAIESPLPAPIQEALGELVGAARERLLALSVGIGLGVVHELLALDDELEVVGPKGKHNRDRGAERQEHEEGRPRWTAAAFACGGHGCPPPMTSAS